MKCGRRDEIGGADVFNFPTEDAWVNRDGYLACNYCGSAHPDEVFKAIEAGQKITPTDKSYKIYIEGGPFMKFYFQHFSKEECLRFIDLLNAKKIVLDEPGYFYVKPFFIA